MAQAAHVAPVLPKPPRDSSPGPLFRFEGLIATNPRSLARGRSTTFVVSVLAHVLIVAAVIVVPLFFDTFLPAPAGELRAFFVTPAEMAPPPPPPPPPAAGVRPRAKAPAAPRPAEPATFVAPVVMPEEFAPIETLDLGVEGGVAGGVEGGVPGGVVGGIVGGLPQEAPPPAKVVRVGGAITAPKLVREVKPMYPDLARQARASGLVILEAQVDTKGYVKTVKVLRGSPLFDDAAIEAVRQWRYAPLLLNGIPTEFILTVTIQFNLVSVPQGDF